MQGGVQQTPAREWREDSVPSGLLGAVSPTLVLGSASHPPCAAPARDRAKPQLGDGQLLLQVDAQFQLTIGAPHRSRRDYLVSGDRNLGNKCGFDRTPGQCELSDVETEGVAVGGQRYLGPGRE